MHRELVCLERLPFYRIVHSRQFSCMHPSLDAESGLRPNHLPCHVIPQPPQWTHVCICEQLGSCPVAISSGTLPLPLGTLSPSLGTLPLALGTLTLFLGPSSFLGDPSCFPGDPSPFPGQCNYSNVLLTPEQKTERQHLPPLCRATTVMCLCT